MFYDKNIDSKQIAPLKCWIYLREFYASPIIEVYTVKLVESVERGVRDSDAIETPNVSSLRFSEHKMHWRLECNPTWISCNWLHGMKETKIFMRLYWTIKFHYEVSANGQSRSFSESKAFHARITGWLDRNWILVGGYAIEVKESDSGPSKIWQIAICTQNRLLTFRRTQQSMKIRRKSLFAFFIFLLSPSTMWNY